MLGGARGTDVFDASVFLITYTYTSLRSVSTGVMVIHLVIHSRKEKSVFTGKVNLLQPPSLFFPGCNPKYKALYHEMSLPYPAPVSSCWKWSHCLPYMCGGLTFLIGSACYLPEISDFQSGGWLFTIGSFSFTFTDIFEWLQNNHVGCFAGKEYNDSYADYCAKRGHPDPKLDTAAYESTYWRFKRAEPGLNFFMSVIGSTLYLIGSICFIPATDSIVTGTWIFIYGSAFIFLSQSWKLYRGGCDLDSNQEIAYSSSNSVLPAFRVKQMLSNIAAFGIDFGAGAGGVCYFIGSIFFLPQYDISDAVTQEAAVWFIAGGFLFFASGLCMFIVYFLQSEEGEKTSLLAAAGVENKA